MFLSLMLARSLGKREDNKLIFVYLRMISIVGAAYSTICIFECFELFQTNVIDTNINHYSNSNYLKPV